MHVSVLGLSCEAPAQSDFFGIQSFFWGYKMFFSGYKKIVLDIFGGQKGSYQLFDCGSAEGGPAEVSRRLVSRRLVSRRLGPRRVGPKCRAFLSLSRRNFHSFFSLWGLLVEFWLWLKRPGAQMCTFGLSGCRVKPRRLRGFTRQPENYKRAHLRVPAFNHTTKIQRNDPQENENCGGRGKKKARNFGRSGGGGPADGEPGSAQILDAPTKILNTHAPTHHTTTTTHHTTQRGIPHRMVLGKKGSLAVRSMAQKSRHEQQIVPKSSSIGQGFLG